MKEKLFLTLIRIWQFLLPRQAARFASNLFFTPRKTVYHERDLAFLASGKPLQLESGRAAWGFGQPNNPSIWFVHGWASHAGKFAVIVDACVKRGFHCVAWDAPAHGRSPGDRTSLMAITHALVSDVQAYAGDKVYALVGHSLGGVCVALSCKYGLKPNKLALIAAPASIKGVLDRYMAYMGLSGSAAEGFLEDVAAENKVGYIDVEPEHNASYFPVEGHIIHDNDDPEIPYSDALAWLDFKPKFLLHKTQRLGHQKILYDREVARYISMI